MYNNFKLYCGFGEVLHMFFKHVGVCNSNEPEVLAILETLQYFSNRLIVKRDLSN